MFYFFLLLLSIINCKAFIIFPKPINSVYICGVVFVFFGIGMNIVIKQQQNDNRNRTSREKRSGSGGVEMV